MNYTLIGASGVALHLVVFAIVHNAAGVHAVPATLPLVLALPLTLDARWSFAARA